MITNSIINAQMALLSFFTAYWLKVVKMFTAIKAQPCLSVTFLPIAGLSVMPPFNLSTLQWSIILLGFFIVGDFLSGLGASYVEKKAREKLDEKEKLKSLIESEKLRKTVIKTSAYIYAILGVWAIESIFFIKTFRFDSVSNLDWSVTLLIVFFCLAVEFWSIVMENFKRMGFDLAGRIVSTGKGIKNLFSEVKDIQK